MAASNAKNSLPPFLQENFELLKGETTLFNKLDDRVKQLLQLDATTTPELRKIHTKYNIEWFLPHKLFVAPAVTKVLVDRVTPDWSFFLKLPSANSMPLDQKKSVWAIYVCCMEKEGSKPRLAIGSATAQAGAHDRLRRYAKITKTLPQHVKTSIAEGYKIVHLGFLACIPLPNLTVYQPLRAWVITIESYFHFFLWSIWQSPNNTIEQNEGHYMRNLCPFAITDLDWDGINSHSPMREATVPITEFTDEEAAAIIAARRARQREAERRYDKSEKGKNSRAAKNKRYVEDGTSKANSAKYNASMEGKARKMAYKKSEAGKANDKKYRESEKGRATINKNRKKHAQSAKGCATKVRPRAEKALSPEKGQLSLTSILITTVKTTTM